MQTAEEYVALIKSAAVVVVAGGATAAAAWRLSPAPRRLWPPPRNRSVPWGGTECLLSLVVLLLLAQVVLALSPWREAGGKSIPLSVQFAVSAAVFPFAVFLTVHLINSLSGARLFHLGLTVRQTIRDIPGGYVVWACSTPVVLLLHWAVTTISEHWTQRPPPVHDLVQMVKENAGRSWIVLLALFQAIVVAPVREELFFRGLLQPWLSRRPWGGDLAMGLSFVAAAGQWTREPFNWTVGLPPMLFVLATLPVYCLLRDRQTENAITRWVIRWVHGPDDLSRVRTARAIFGTAVLFGMIHSIWPTPIPLTVLGIALGWLAHRTQGVVGPVFVHALFNAVAFGALLIML